MIPAFRKTWDWLLCVCCVVLGLLLLSMDGPLIPRAQATGDSYCHGTPYDPATQGCCPDGTVYPVATGGCAGTTGTAYDGVTTCVCTQSALSGQAAISTCN
jgi:hypothetical protein